MTLQVFRSKAQNTGKNLLIQQEARDWLKLIEGIDQKPISKQITIKR